MEKKVRLGPYVEQWVIDRWEGYAESLGLAKATTLAAMVLTAIAREPEFLGHIVAGGAQATAGCGQPKKAVSIPPRDADSPSGGQPKKAVGSPPRATTGGWQPEKSAGIPPQPHHLSHLSVLDESREEREEEISRWGNLAQQLIDGYPHGWDDDGNKHTVSPVDVDRALMDLVRDGVDLSDSLAGAKRLAQFKPGPQARYNRGLVKWLKAKGWQSKLQKAPGHEDPDTRAKNRDEANKRAADALVKAGAEPRKLGFDYDDAVHNKLGDPNGTPHRR